MEIACKRALLLTCKHHNAIKSLNWLLEITTSRAHVNIVSDRFLFLFHFWMTCPFNVKTILLMLKHLCSMILVQMPVALYINIPCLKEGYGCTPFTIWHRQKRTFQFHSIYHWTWSKQSNLQGKLSSLRYPDLIYSNRAFLPDTINCLWIFSSLYPPQKGNKKEACTASSLRRFIDIDAVGILPIFTRGSI